MTAKLYSRIVEDLRYVRNDRRANSAVWQVIGRQFNNIANLIFGRCYVTCHPRRSRLRIHCMPLQSVESLEYRVLLATFDATIVHDAGPCREADSVKVGISPSVSGEKSSFVLLATPPGHGDPIPVGEQSDFTGCDFDSDPTGGPGEVLVGEVDLQNGDKVQFFRNDGFWQAPIDLVHVGDQTFADITRFALSRAIRPGDFRQYATGTSDGYVRQISLPQQNLIDLTFNSSAVLGNTEIVTLPSGEERYRANIATLVIDTDGAGWEASHRDSGQTRVTVLSVSPKQTALQADFTGFTSQFPVVITSMNSSFGDNTSDMNVVMTRDAAGDVHYDHVRDVAGATIQDLTGLGTLKSVLTDHNTNGIDLSVYAADASLLGGTQIYEVEQYSMSLPTIRRPKASPALDEGDTTVWMNPPPSPVTVTIPTTIPRTGYYAYGIDYSRESTDSVQSTVTLRADSAIVGSFDATSSRLPSTPSDPGSAWNEPKPAFFGTMFHIAGEQVDLQLDVSGPDADVGIEADVVTRVFVGSTLQPRIIDNGDDGYSDTGDWTLSPVVEGREGDIRFARAGDGSKVATWAFSGLASGKYRVSATWSVHPNRATNAPYTIRAGVGGVILDTALVNQELAPDDFTDSGSTWEDLALVTITGSELVVELSNAADQYVIADAIRVVETLEPLPEVVVIDDGEIGYADTGWELSPVGQGFRDDLRYTGPGDGSRTATWTFTGLEPGHYHVSATWAPHPNRATNAPFTILDGAGGDPLAIAIVNQELAPDDLIANGGAWEDLAIVTISGNELVVELTNAANEYVIADAIRIERNLTPPPPPQFRIIDDGDADYSDTGWEQSPVMEGRLNDLRYAPAGNGSQRATWTFTGLTPGNYIVAATWAPHPNRATNAPFTIYDGIGGSMLETVLVNQELAPNDFTANGSDWEDLTIVTISGSDLVVELSNNANQYVIADAIRIARTTEQPTLGASIIGEVFQDFDRDGVKSAGEPPVLGATVFLDRNNNGELDGGDSSVQTGANGSYSFDGLQPGSYTVAIVRDESIWRQTTPDELQFAAPDQLPDPATFVAAADVNDDRVSDLVTLSLSTDQVFVTLSGSDPSARAAYSVPDSPRGADFGDFDNDGDTDVAVVSFVGRALTILMNQGDGQFSIQPSIAVGRSAGAVASGDVNGDGFVDVVVANQGGFTSPGFVTLLLNQGQGVFGDPVTFSAGVSPDSLVLRDFDQDGQLDLAVADGSFDRVWVLMNNGAGGFASAVANPSNAPRDIRADDVDLDGDLDLLVANHIVTIRPVPEPPLYSNTVQVYANLGDGTFANPVSVEVGMLPRSIDLVDLDDDGDNDLIAANGIDDTALVLLNESGAFTPTFTVVLGDVEHVRGADVDGDGDTDLIFAQRDETPAVYRNTRGAHLVSLVSGETQAGVDFGWIPIGPL